MQKIVERKCVDIENINAMAIADARELVDSAIADYERQIDEIVQAVLSQNKKIVIVSGPSSAGKTTTSYKIKKKIIESGVNSFVISLDDFFKNASQLPLKANGKPDFETIELIDIECLHNCLEEIITKNETMLPMFDFKSGSRSETWVKCSLKEQDVVIIEGTHALNPIITEDLNASKFYRVYAHCNTQFMLNGKIEIGARDLRLIRRIIRDSRDRNCNPLRTISMWKDVCEGEEIYIRPYKMTADYFLNSTHVFEPLLYKNLAVRQLSILADSGEQSARNLLRRLECCLTINDSIVPEDALVREFYKSGATLVNGVFLSQKLRDKFSK